MRIEFYKEGEEKLIFSVNANVNYFEVGQKINIETTIGSTSDSMDYEVAKIETFTNEAFGINVENRDVVKITVKEIEESND